MSNEIRSIASVEGVLNRKRIDIYNEADLMKPVGTDMFGTTCYTIEEFEVQRYVSDNYAVGMCVNSYPFFCRYDLCEYGDGTERESWLEHLNAGNSVHKQMKDVANYERTCPKCGWGVSAYLAIRCRPDARWGVRYYDRYGNETSQRTTFEAYLTICRKVYQAKHRDEYQHYKAIGDVEAIGRLEAEFLSQHREAEEQNRNISGEVDRRFFGGQLASVVAAYMEYIANVEAGGHQEAQEADKWVIGADVTLRVFGGNRAKAVAYLSEVVGHGYSATEYGKETKRLKIDIPFGYGKLFWEMICANDTSQTKKGYSTFNKGRS